MDDTAAHKEIDATLAPIKAANPGISNGEAATHLPAHLRQAFWARAVENYLKEACPLPPPR